MTSKHLIARKTHQCDACGLEIEPGEKYWRCDWLPSENESGEFEMLKLDFFCERVVLSVPYPTDGVDSKTALSEYLGDLREEWGVDTEMHVHHLLESLARHRSQGDLERLRMTARALRAELDSYEGTLLDKEAILAKVLRLEVYDGQD